MKRIEAKDLPVFVQRRGYETGALASVRIVFDPHRRFGTTPVFEGTRSSPTDFAGDIEDGASDEWIAHMFSLTTEHIRVAREWLAAHPECERCQGAGSLRNGRTCKGCGGHGRLYSEAERRDIERSVEETRRIWARPNAGGAA